MEEILKLYQELRGLVSENDSGVEICHPICRIIQETIDQIPSETRIVIRPAGNDTRRLLELYDFSGKNVVGIMHRRSREGDFCGYPCFTTDSFSSQMCDCVIICSGKYHREISEELEKLHVTYIDIYDELEKRGFHLSVSHHFYATHFHLEVNYFYSRYLRSEPGPQREIALRELLQVAVKCKDFTLISEIYQACGGENGEIPLLKAVWKKSKQLLDCIQKKLQARKQKDIVLFWTDAVGHDKLQDLPGTMELSKQGVFFQRAYTHTPFTDSTMLALFCAMFPIDDFPQNQEKIDSSNSPLIQFMESKGYKVRLIGDPDVRPMGKEHLIEAYEYLSCNVEWWEGIVDLLQSPEPCFYIFHFLESHRPCIVPDLKESVDPDTVSQAQWEVRIKAASGYLDKCLLLYHKLLGNKTQIFFSDHGNHLYKNIAQWTEQVLHPYCFVVGENIPKKIITQFFPYRNFEKLVRWLVDPEHFSLDDVCADEVIFQDTDFYNPRGIDNFIRMNEPRKGLAYRGILNYNYKYVINALGEEYFYQRQQDGTEKLIPLEDSALRDELRGKAGTEFLDINRYDKFRHTKKLYDFINQTEQNGVDNVAYWDQYYRNQVCSENPSLFAQYVATLVEPGRRMVELGCGNGRDAVFFSGKGLHITALDLSQEAISQLQDRDIANATFLCGDFVNSDIHSPDSYDYAYSRFTIHAINRNQEQVLLNNLFRSLRPNGKLFIEARGVNDPLFGKGKQVEHNAFFYDNHYRRFIVLDELVHSLEQHGFLVEYAQERTGFAPYGKDDSPMIRIVAVKPEKTEN